MDPKTRKTLISVIVAGVIIVGVLAITVVGGTAFFFYRHINTQFTPRENAEAQFAEARKRFGGEKPLIEMRRGDEPIFHRELIAESQSTARIETLRVLAYDPDARKLVRVSIPFWLIRLAPSKNFSFLNNHGVEFDDSERVRVTAADLERRGPGLILDERDRHGALVLVWTE
jgi:hypothetical protein